MEDGGCRVHLERSLRKFEHILLIEQNRNISQWDSSLGDDRRIVSN